MSTTHPRVDDQQKTRSLPLKELPGTLVNRRWWWTTLLVILGMITMVRLGIWQLDRLEQRRTNNAAYLAKVASPPVEISGNYTGDELDALYDRQARASGYYDFDRQIILVQQSYRGIPGAHLVTPLILADGSAILVDRGWISADDLAAGDLDRFNERGEQTVIGALQKSQALSGDRQGTAEEYGNEWYRVDVESIQESVPYDLWPVFLLAGPDTILSSGDRSEDTNLGENRSEVPIRLEPQIELDDGPHLGYAIQWFLFTVILALGYLRFVSTRSNG